MSRIDDVRQMPYVVAGYTFAVGGEDDLLQLDFERDAAQGFGTPAKSFVVRNAGPGVVSFMLSEDGEHWSAIGTIPAGNVEGYDYFDGITVKQMKLWASAANTVVSIRAVPGRKE